MLSPKDKHIGGRLSRKQREKKEARDIGFYAYKNAKTLAAERGKDISKAINMGLPENRILSKLGLDYKPIKNISINAHGAIGEGLKPAFIKVPKNAIINYTLFSNKLNSREIRSVTVVAKGKDGNYYKTVKTLSEYDGGFCCG